MFKEPLGCFGAPGNLLDPQRFARADPLAGR
jgi:hypothetical protein